MNALRSRTRLRRSVPRLVRSALNCRNTRRANDQAFGRRDRQQRITLADSDKVTGRVAAAEAGTAGRPGTSDGGRSEPIGTLLAGDGTGYDSVPNWEALHEPA